MTEKRQSNVKKAVNVLIRSGSVLVGEAFLYPDTVGVFSVVKGPVERTVDGKYQTC